MTNGWHPHEDESRKQATQATLKPEPQSGERNEKSSSAENAADRKDAPATDDGE